MTVRFDDIENAFMFVSMDQKHMNSACLCRKSGDVFYSSEMGDSDELPEDIYDSEQYIEIPHKTDLNLGNVLAINFTSTHMPDHIQDVYSFFSGRGAYSKFKNLLDSNGLLDEWHSFEEKRQREALREWCKENNIKTAD